MNPEEIKVGKTYRIELLCILNKENVIVFETPTGDHIPLRNSDIECVSSANGIKSAKNAQKYDPCRKFRKGDKVRFRKVNDRFTPDWDAKTFVGTLGKVYSDERASGNVTVLCCDDVYRTIDATYLELITPVEELEPYSVKELRNVIEVVNSKETEVRSAVFFRSRHPHAKEAAEEECARLNEEYRKERSDG